MVPFRDVLGFVEDFAVAHDGVERSAQLMAYAREIARLREVCGVCLGPRLGELSLNAPAFPYLPLQHLVLLQELCLGAEAVLSHQGEKYREYAGGYGAENQDYVERGVAVEAAYAGLQYPAGSQHD